MSSVKNAVSQHIEDVDNRKNDLILHRVPESTSDDTEVRKNNDMSFFLELCNDGLRVKMEQNKVIKAFRLGKKKVDDNPRPLLLRLESEQRKNNMGELKRLKYDDIKFSNVGVSHDLTQDQRKAIKLALDEAWKQPQSGNLKLKVSK